jgi:ankyrin repeat protein/Flp pilus assembly protein TadD
MSKIAIRAPRAFLLSLAIALGGAGSVLAQHGSGAGGGVVENAGAVMKLPAKKVVRTPPASSKPKAGTRPQPVDNSAQLEDALSLADDARQHERYEAAERGYQLAARLVPSDPRPYLGLGHSYYSQKKFVEAEKSYLRAAGLSHGDSEPYARLAFTYSELQRLDEALNAAHRSIAAQPDNYYGYLALGYVLSLSSRNVEAEAAYRKAVTLTPQPLVVLHLELVRVLSAQRRYKEGAVEAKKAVDIDPKDFSAHFNYALMLQKLGQLAPSATQYLQAIELNPKDGSPHSNVGLIYYMTEDFSSARSHWNAAVSLGSTYDPDRIGLLILDGRLAEARTQLEEYTQKNADDEDGWLMLGDVYRALGDDSRARVTDARAAQIAPEYVGLRRPELRKLNQRGFSATNNSRPASSSDVLKVDEKGRTALMLAAGRGQTDLIPSIIAAGVNVNARDLEGDTALFYAATNGRLEAVDALLKAGADVGSANKKGSTSLIGAATEGYPQIVKLLLARGARVDQGDEDGDNALLLASALGKSDILDVLLAGRANINYQNKNGVTPLMIASFQGMTPAVRLLVARGANVNLRAKNGVTTALSLARSKNHADVVDVLQRAGAVE